MEILVVIAITGMMAAVAAGVVKERKSEASYLLTLEIVTNIKKAIVGVYTPLVRGTAISGYVANMGSLPHLNHDGQPESLWRKTRGLPGSVYLPSSSASSSGSDEGHTPPPMLWAGWNGPYLEAPETGFLTDGWGAGLIFKIDEGELTITSYGADKKPGGSGYKEDIRAVIRKTDYMAPVGGHVVAGANVKNIKLHFPKDGEIDGQGIELTPDKSGNFMTPADTLAPIGLRSLSMEIDDEEQVFVFQVHPLYNWQGNFE